MSWWGRLVLHVPRVPVTQSSDWQGEVLIDVVLHVLFITPLYFSSCPSSISLPSCCSHITPPPSAWLLRALPCRADCDPTLEVVLPLARSPWACALRRPGSYPTLDRARDTAKIGRLTRLREKVMGSGGASAWWAAWAALGLHALSSSSIWALMASPNGILLLLKLFLGAHWWNQA